MTDAVLYARVSSKEQREMGFSIEAQVRLLREYAEQNDIKIIREFIEVETAKCTGRPLFDEMLTFIRQTGSCHAILCEKTDRLYRNFSDMLTLDEMDIDIHFAKEGMVVGPNAKSSDKFVHGIRVLMAKNYIDNLREELMKGMREKVLQGGWPHKAPFGYRNIDGPESVEPDPETGPIVTWMFTRLAEGGITPHQLYREYSQSDFKHTVAKSKFYVILVNPFYKGVMKWQGDLYPGKYKPLVDEDTWERVQSVIKKPDKPLDTNGKTDFTYRYLIKCDHCGCDIVAEKKKGKYIYYHCTQGRGPCKENGYIRQEVLDRQFLEALDEIQLEPDVAENMIDKLRSHYQDEMDEREDLIRSLRLTSRSIQLEIDNLRSEKLNRRISERKWRQRQESLMDRLNAVFAQIKTIQHETDSIYPYTARLILFKARAKDIFAGGDSAIKRRVVTLALANFSLSSGTLMNTTNKALHISMKGLKYGLVGQVGLEPTTYGFGDRCSTN